jgi:hypothetical protein
MSVVYIAKPQKAPQLFKLKLMDMLVLGDKSGWVEVMDYIYQEMPFLMKDARPKTSEIKNSLLGQLGYTSWKTFIEEELNWTNDKWRDWKKAYKRVQEYPYLRELNVSRNAINEAHKACKGDFPKDSVAWESYMQNKVRPQGNSVDISVQKNMDLDNSLNILTIEYEWLVNQLEGFEKEYDDYCDQLSNEKSKTKELSQQLLLLQQEKETEEQAVKAESMELKMKIKKLLSATKSMKNEISQLNMILSEKKLEIEKCYEEIDEQYRVKKYMVLIALLTIVLLMFVNV